MNGCPDDGRHFFDDAAQRCRCGARDVSDFPAGAEQIAEQTDAASAPIWRAEPNAIMAGECNIYAGEQCIAVGVDALVAESLCCHHNGVPDDMSVAVGPLDLGPCGGIGNGPCHTKATRLTRDSKLFCAVHSAEWTTGCTVPIPRPVDSIRARFSSLGWEIDSIEDAVVELDRLSDLARGDFVEGWNHIAELELKKVAKQSPNPLTDDERLRVKFLTAMPVDPPLANEYRDLFDRYEATVRDLEKKLTEVHP